MFVLAEFNVLRPEPGLFFWSVLFFLIFWFMIAKFAFKPIANALIIRENHIQDALLDASKAKEELRTIQEENTRMMEEARAQRSQMMKEAKNLGFSDEQISRIMEDESTDDDIYKRRKELGITRVYKMVDTCSAEFEAKTPYFYSTFE